MMENIGIVEKRPNNQLWEKNRMPDLRTVRKRWEKLELPVVFYHTTFVENAIHILQGEKIIANKGYSICQSKNGFVSLSDGITKAIIEFFGNVTFEFDALSLYEKNKLLAPRDYAISEDDIKRYDELPFFENEWVVPEELKFNLKDINKILLITNKDFREPAFDDITPLLQSKGTEYTFLSEKWLSDNVLSDTIKYFFRIENWEKFKNEGVIQAI
ncbi:MAG: hypothetical protein WA977_06465 [Halobacteriota archaeon]